MSEKYWRACSDEKLETPTMASPTLRTGTIGLFTSMFLNKESVLLFGKTLQKHAKQLIKNNLTGGHWGN
nr:hypothetical protein [uncultured Alloprevotella sp.]